MVRSTNIVLRILPVMVGIVMMAAMSGCVREQNRDDCPPDVPPPPPKPELEELIVVTVVDAETGESVITSEIIQDGSLFFFDTSVEELSAIGYIPVAKEQLGKEKPFPTMDDGRQLKPGDVIFISAWGNIEGNMNVEGYYEPGQNIYTPFLHMIPNMTYTEYYMCPGVLFFGMRRIVVGEVDAEQFDHLTVNPDGSKKLVHEIRITQLNALMTIQVENLPEGFNPEDYYFDIGKQNSGYDYQGLPFVDTDEVLHNIRETGIVNPDGYLVTEVPYNLIPSIGASSVDDITADKAVELHLYQRAATRAEGDVDLTGPVSKIDYGDGDYIGLYPRQTTHVRIRFPPGGPGTGDITVEVRVIPWEEINQWSGWN